MLRIFLLLIVVLSNGLIFCQILIKGTVSDERNSPIPYAKVYVKNAPDLRTISDVYGNYEMRLNPGEYYLIFNAGGFDQRESYLSVTERDLSKNMQLFPSMQDIADVSIKSKKTNPGRDKILKVVKKREQINMWNYPHSVDVYIKANEKRSERSGKKRKKKKEKKERKDPSGMDDPFSENKNNQLANNMNLAELQATRHFAPPNKVKEIRNAYELRGSDRDLYYTTTVKSNFNFFENLLQLDDLHQTPITSPISNPGIFSYKYRLVEKFEEDGKTISKIKIIPRKTSTSTLAGYIYVIDSLWLIHKIELSLKKGNLLVYDYFNIIQEFETPGDSICVLVKQELSYGVKYSQDFSNGSTEAVFSNYNFNPKFGKRFFGTEVAVTEQEAYEKDTSYWSDKRGAVLSPEEQRFIVVKDSIHDAHNKKEYLDSIDSVFNKLTVLKVLWWGVEHRNRVKKTQWQIGSLASIARPLYIAGPRIAPSFYFFKKWKDERMLDGYTEITYGFLNKDIKGNSWWDYRFDPFHFGTLEWSFNHDFDVIRGYDAITQIYKRENFIEATSMSVGVEYELINGLYLNISSEFTERRSLDGYDFITAFDDDIPNTDPNEFESYQALLGNISLSYTPQQKYMREPNRKVLLGSAWPTFYLNYERGIPSLFGSDIDHEYLEFSFMQTLKIGTIGTTTYRGAVGKFLSSKNLREPDYKFQRRSDPIWFSNPLYSFQGLDSTLPTKDYTWEAHIVHHDNGAIINKIPFMKKTRIGLVVGASALYVKEHNWQHYEFLAGLERNFKFSRRRLRIGIYGVLSDGNNIAPQATWKVSFAVLDDRNMKWNF